MCTRVATVLLGVVDLNRQALSLGAGLAALLVFGAAGASSAATHVAKVAVHRPKAIAEGVIPHLKTVHFSEKGHTRTYHTAAKTVGDFLASLQITTSPLTEIAPSLGARISNGMTIRMSPVALAVEKQQVTLSFPVRKVSDPTLPRGQSHIKKKGHNGSAILSIYESNTANGLVLRQNMDEYVVQPATAEVVAEGTATVAPAARTTSHGLHVVKVLTLLATAYWANPAWSNGRTALGLQARHGVVAVDPRVIPLGTRLYIPGYGAAIAGDTGSAIVGNRIDLCMNNGRAAIDFGKQWIKVDVLGP